MRSRVGALEAAPTGENIHGVYQVKTSADIKDLLFIGKYRRVYKGSPQDPPSTFPVTHVSI